MSGRADTSERQRTSTASYVVNVARMQLVNKWIFIGVPALITTSALLVVVLIGLLFIPDGEIFNTGAGQAALWYFLVAGVQALTATFPFSQGMSITRRNYFLGTVATFAAVAIGYGLVFYLLGLIERATDGWGVGAGIYALPWWNDGAWYDTILLVAAASAALFIIGLWVATIYKRWGTIGVVITGLAVALVLVGVAWVFNATSSWLELWHWMVAQTPLSVAGWLGLLIVALGVGSFLTLRRALP